MKYGFYIFIAVLLLTSCAKKEVELTPAQIKVKADSIITIRENDLTRQYTEDLEKRVVVEVKGKADSIVEASMKINGKADTVIVHNMEMGTRPNPRRIDTTRKHPVMQEP